MSHRRDPAGDPVELLQKPMATGADAYRRIGTRLCQTGRLPDGIRELRRAVESSPSDAVIRNELGHWLRHAGKYPEAESSFRTAIRLDPQYCVPYANLGSLLARQGRLAESIEAYTEAVRLYPEYAAAFANLSQVFARTGELESAIACLKRACAIEPDSAALSSDLLLISQFSHEISPVAHKAAAGRWAARHAHPLPRRYTNQRSRDRRLRVGYVSADFRTHISTFFHEPMLANHDRANFEIYCYSSTSDPDATTDRFRTYSDHWRDVTNLTDDALADSVRSDAIDILVDLNGHVSRGRMLLMVSAPAPVQFTIPHFPSTLGVAAVQYRIADRHTCPPGSEDLYTEQLVRLPSFLCYSHPPASPPIGPSPHVTKGFVTFGSFSHPLKLNSGVIDLWAEILHRVPHSHLLLHHYFGRGRATNREAIDSRIESRLRGEFESRGLASERLELVGGLSHFDHLALYHRVDIALDTFPFAGTTTTCEALWMGVPVVTLAGQDHKERTGVSFLSSAGREDLIARTADEYTRIAVGLAEDTATLQRYRAELRVTLQNSPVMNAEAYTRALEQAYRRAWHSWTDSSTT